MNTPRISIVVSIDAFHPVHSFVSGFMQQSRPFDDFEVIVVDAEPRASISTAIVEARMKTQGALNIQYFTIESSRRAALNNFGVAKGGSGLVVFNCNDFVPTSSFVDAHLRFHERHPEPYVVGIGPGLFPEAQRDASRFLAWLEDAGKLFGFSFTSKDGSVPSSFFCVANSSVKKNFLAAAGRFDEDFPYACWDDYEMGVRLVRNGMTALLVPEGVAHHDHPITVR